MGKEKQKRPAFAFTVCLLLAAFSWLFITFSKDYEATLDFRIHCVNLPEGKHSVTVSDSVLSLTFNQKRLSYYMKPYSRKGKTVDIDISELVKPKRRVSVYTFTAREMRDFLAQKKFGPGLKKVESPEVLTFYLK